MFIANETKKTNIVEYLLYMWQIENIIRVCNFSIDKIFETVIKPQGLDSNQIDLEKDWYLELISKMKEEGITKDGHLNQTKEVINELSFLHNSLLNELNNQQYKMLYAKTKADIEELKKLQNGVSKTDVDVIVNGLYAFWMLKLGKKEISNETTRAMDRLTKLVAFLAQHYKKLMFTEQ